MKFSEQSFDPETLASLGRVFEEAWEEFAGKLVVKPVDASAARTKMALRIMDAARNGERDPKRLKSIGLRAVDRR